MAIFIKVGIIIKTKLMSLECNENSFLHELEKGYYSYHLPTLKIFTLLKVEILYILSTVLIVIKSNFLFYFVFGKKCGI